MIRAISWLSVGLWCAVAGMTDWKSAPGIGICALAIAGIMAISARRKWAYSTIGMWATILLSAVAVGAICFALL